MNRQELTKAIGQEVALSTHWGRVSLGTEHARKVTVVDGPFERRWAASVKGYVETQGQGQLWKVSWTEDGYSHEGEPKEGLVKSKDVLGLWADHEPVRARNRAERKEAAEARQRAEDEASAWNAYVTDALELLGIDWAATRRPGSITVAMPAAVLEQLLAVASREPVPSGN